MFNKTQIGKSDKQFEFCFLAVALHYLYKFKHLAMQAVFRNIGCSKEIIESERGAVTGCICCYKSVVKFLPSLIFHNQLLVL